MSAPGPQLRLRTLTCHGLLLDADGGRGLEGDLDHNVLTVGEAALDAARAVGAGADLPVLRHVELVVVLRAQHAAATEAAANLKALGSWKREHGLGQLRLQLVKHGGAEALGAVAHHAGHLAATGLAPVADIVDSIDHALRCLLVGAPHDVALHVSHCEVLMVNVRVNVLDAVHVRQNLSSTHNIQQFLCNGSGCNTTNGLPSGGSATTSDSTNAILKIVSSVRMRWPVSYGHLAVILRALVLVADQNGNWAPKCDTVIHARKNLRNVLLLSGGCDDALSRLSAVQLKLNFLLTDLQARRHAIDHTANTLAVRFTEGGHSESSSISAASSTH
mmetsp:Transcript_5384/g.11838  ORF Transcript_5384/g.11838 Transcript_5384/m.11838 type:complete len:332 (-) Transcript_5384:186-1181(-)